MVWKQGTGERKLVVFADPELRLLQEVRARPAGGQGRHRLHLPVSDPRRRFAREVAQIWCAKDNTKAWRDWMIKGTPIPEQPRPCDASALQRNVALGRKHRITGTPGLVFEDGRSKPAR